MVEFRVGDRVKVGCVIPSWHRFIDKLSRASGREGVVTKVDHEACLLAIEGEGLWWHATEWLELVAPAQTLAENQDEEYTGGSVSYYTVHIDKPTTEGVDPYDAECNDIIEALEMNYAEGNAFKAIWRRCAARKGKAKKGYTDGLYDAQKVVFFGQRLVAQEEANAS